MPGFAEDPRSHINLIKDNLSDRYKTGFPVLRELIQNADDAGATRVAIGSIASLADVPHPLFQGPAIFALNNGTFTSEDDYAIRRLGLSAKPSQRML